MTALFVGRESESRRFEEMLEEADAGESRVLALYGEPGIGKTELVESVVASARDWRVIRTLGVEAEAELPFAALHQLCSPLLEFLDEVPKPQRDALGAAFGLVPGTGSEPFLIGLAALTLLSAASQRRPLLCIIDDAQWLDGASGQVLGFVARRLSTDPIIMIFMAREHSEQLIDLPQMNLVGLGPEESELLLSSTLEAQLSPLARQRVIALARGNPLALLELPKGLTPSELSVGFGGTAEIPLSNQIEETFGRRIERLPVMSQQLLTLAAADQLGDAAKLWRAAETLGIGPEAARGPDISDLVAIDASVQFRHPLVRSAAYHRASLHQRKLAHQALAAASDPVLDPDRRAWHLAAATVGPDESVAAELEQSAGRAQERGGIIAAATFLRRSAELTSDSQLRATRQLKAAAAYLESGAPEQARECLRRSASRLTDPLARAHAMRLEGALRYSESRGSETPSLLFGAATALHDLDPALSDEAMAEALESAMWAGELTTGTTTADVARTIRSWSRDGTPATTASLVLQGFSERLLSGYPGPVKWWAPAIEAGARDVSGRTRLQLLGMLWNLTGDMLDFDHHLAIARERVRYAREIGALATLPAALARLGWSEHLAGRTDSAEACIEEGATIAVATGAQELPGATSIVRLGLLAWRGSEAEVDTLAKEVFDDVVQRGNGQALRIVDFYVATLELAYGRYADARTRLLRVFEEDPLYLGSLGLADLVEASWRSNDRESALAALARLTARAEDARTPWALGLLARARALVSPDDEADRFFNESVQQLDRSGVARELPRTRLLYGEWLRRQRRRRDAREQLHSAHDAFLASRAEAFAHRCEVELLASGEHARVRDHGAGRELTPQELQIAQMAAGGESNRDIAAKLFISPHTVSYHLRKIYAKLGVMSRTQLANALEESANGQSAVRTGTID